MKKLYRIGKITAAVLLATSAWGCIDVEYVGQSFPALPDYAEVPIYDAKNPMPESSVYRPIGRVQLNANDDCTAGDIRAELEKTAREHGAEAVKIVRWGTRILGTTAPEGSANWQPSDNHTGYNLRGEYIYRNSFGSQPATLAKPAKTFHEIEVEALLLVSEKRFNEFAPKKAGPPVADTGKTVMPDKKMSRDQALEIAPVAPQDSNKTPERQPVKMELSGDQASPVVL